jgi:hypothetical protein
LKKLFSRWTTWLVIFLLLFGVTSCLVSRVDRTPYQQTEYYRQFKEELARLPSETVSGKQPDTLQAGWAKVNITPGKAMPLAGYGLRKGRKYASVHDSLWARAFVFSNGIQKTALLTVDLLIVPPALTEAITRKLPQIGFTIDRVYLTATHSHHSAGGWAHRLSGWAIAGSYQQSWVDDLASCMVEAIRLADGRKRKASMGVATFPAGELVFNRLARDRPTDSLIRVLKIRQVQGATAVIVTFSAHATTLHSGENILSRDYPGMLVDTLERNSKVDFAAYCAGAVGSHAPEAPGEHLEAMRVGSSVWIGTPADFSGELVPPLQQAAAPADLFVTSFNGGYMGYITNDACYDRRHYETRDMNWYGPQNGAYLSEAITELLKRL